MSDLSQESPLWREWAESRHSVQQMREELERLRAENARKSAQSTRQWEAGMGEWTKGDWIATPDPHGSSDDWCIGVEGKIDMVAVCSKRDANLLRSAKDMAEALRMVVAADTAEDWSRAVDYARAALAKAGVE